jgi:hypothetical protein
MDVAVSVISASQHNRCVCHTGELFPSGEAGPPRVSRNQDPLMGSVRRSRSARRRDATRDELVLKLILAAARGPEQLQRVIRSERKAAVETLQEYTRLKRDPVDATDLGWLLLLDSLIFKTESRIRWLDSARTRMAQMPAPTSDAAHVPAAQTAREASATPAPQSTHAVDSPPAPQHADEAARQEVS